MKLMIKAPGLLTTVQDTGRKGYRSIGMPLAGAMDFVALQMGNIIIGNQEDAAALEMTLTGPKVEIQSGEGLVCCAGPDTIMEINGSAAPSWEAFRVQKGDSISFTRPVNCLGSRYYLCFSGGIDVPLFMGSRSTYLRGKLGGHKGRSLQQGDQLSTGEKNVLWERIAGFRAPERLIPDYSLEKKLKAVPGPQDDHFSKDSLESFFSRKWTISTSSDRMGYRLEGEPIKHVNKADIVSDAVPPGSVQIPGDGYPIVMLSDCQTTGGYTKIAVLCTEDRALLSQRLPGATAIFEKTDQLSAVKRVARLREKLNILRHFRARWATRLTETSTFKGTFSGNSVYTMNKTSAIFQHVWWEILEDR